jgi:hypothetical protein
MSIGSVTFPRCFTFIGFNSKIRKRITKLTKIIITKQEVEIFKGRKIQELKMFAPLIKPKPLSTSDVLQLEEQTTIRCTDQENPMRCAPLVH